jgi:hypothetical protein
VSNSDSREDKKRDKPLTATQQLRNVLNGLLDEEGCPPEDRLTTEQRARFEEMRKTLAASRVDEGQAKDFLERLRRNLAEPAPMTKEETEGVKKRLLEQAESWEEEESKRKADAKPKYIN